MDLPDELAALQRFHGHLGIYVTLGLRMGAIGQRTLGGYKGLQATVRTVPKPPMMCVVDGVQFASACTMGKGNIAIEAAQEPGVTFEKEGRRITISLKPGLNRLIQGEMSHDREIERSVHYYEAPEAELFDVREG
ncbi:MAG TPA: formylmethanofuran dehydrogenase subunit E family protein [Thermoplasmata archaeon]|nr:formylmethanofuran dehydrogenase subunit E family protein [Thermoplasmata archaeon]